MRCLLAMLIVAALTACSSECRCALDLDAASPRVDAGAVGDAAIDDAAASDAAATIDDAATNDAAISDASLGSRCEVTATNVTCTHETRVFRTGDTALTERDVHFQLPLGEAPPSGFPVVLMFQGSTVSAERTWAGEVGETFGLYHQARVVAVLLDAGYAVVTPEAAGDGSTWYDTNIPPYATFWETAPDHRLMLAIFAAIDGGELGPLDATRMFATGLSSGGYMTSRMAVSYPGRFRALAIQSASYATCGGSFCVLPATMPAAHPPTLFLHGELDATVPISTMRPYEAALRADGVATRIVTDPALGHEWLPVAPEELLAWFDARRR